MATYGTARTYTTIVSTAEVVIESATSIIDTFNSVSVLADSSMRSFVNIARISASGIGTRPDTRSDTRLTINSLVTIGGTSQADADRACLTADDLVIKAFVGSLAAVDRMYSSGKAFASNVDAHSVFSAIVNVKTIVQNASLRGYDNLDVLAVLSPTRTTLHSGEDYDNGGANVYSHALSRGLRILLRCGARRKREP